MKSRFIILLIAIVIASCTKEPTVFQKPEKPALVSPLLNQTCTSGTVVSDSVSAIPFVWKIVPGATSYELDVQNLLDFTLVTKITTATQFSVDLQPNTPYAWWVKSRSTTTPIATSSDVWKFYSSGSGTLNYAPFPAEIDAPLFGDVVSGSTVTLTWKGSSVEDDIKSYDVYFGTTSSPPLLKKGVADQSIPGVSIQPGNTYYWHVVTTDIYGDYTDSGMYQFSVASL